MKQIDLQRMKTIIEIVNADENAWINGTAGHFEEELAGQGQQLWWNADLGTHFIGLKEDSCPVCGPEECICTK